MLTNSFHLAPIKSFPVGNKCPEYDTKQSDGEVQVMLVLWGMRRNPSLPLLGGPPLSKVVAPNRILSMGQIELICTYTKPNCLKFNLALNH